MGRWWGVDAMAEKYAGWSSYHYGMNNPVLFIDPNGMEIIFSADGSYHATGQDAVHLFVGLLNHYNKRSANAPEQSQQPGESEEHFKERARVEGHGDVHTKHLAKNNGYFESWAPNYIKDFLSVLKTYEQYGIITIILEIDIPFESDAFLPMQGLGYSEALEEEHNKARSYPSEIKEQVKNQISPDGWNPFGGGWVNRPDLSRYNVIKNELLSQLSRNGVVNNNKYKIEYMAKFRNNEHTYLYAFLPEKPKA